MNPADLLQHPTLSVREAAELLGVGAGTLYELVRRDGFPPARRIGRRVVISTTALRRWLEAEGDVAGTAGGEGVSSTRK